MRNVLDISKYLLSVAEAETKIGILKGYFKIFTYIISKYEDEDSQVVSLRLDNPEAKANGGRWGMGRRRLR